jgi:ubiquinone/menaquinone biosynthesis C-methylase UbiE
MRGSFYEQDHFARWLEVKDVELNAALKAEEKFIAKRVHNGSTLLDVGCGTGRLLEVLAKSLSRAVGIDYKKKMLDMAEKKLKGFHNIELLEANVYKIPFPDDSFDYVICTCNTFGNFDQPGVALDELLRVVKPNGEVILGVYSENALPVQLRTYRAIGLIVDRYDSEKVKTHEGLVSKRFSRATLEELAKAHGANAAIQDLTPIFRAVVLTKRGRSP